MKHNKAEKGLRQNIMAIAITTGIWDNDNRRDILEEMGYGRQLTKLDLSQLLKLKKELTGIDKLKDIPEKYKFDSQGMRMYYCLKLAGWNIKRLNSYLVKRFQKTHWNLLRQKEKRGVIDMLKRYAEKT